MITYMHTAIERRSSLLAKPLIGDCESPKMQTDVRCQRRRKRNNQIGVAERKTLRVSSHDITTCVVQQT